MAENRIKDANNNCANVLNEIAVEHLKIDGTQINLKCCKSSGLSDKILEEMLQLTEDNMKEFYEKSNFGWNRAAKLKELRHRTAIFLIAMFDSKLFAFCHFRFEHGSDESEACVYCYEIQVADEYQRRGIGKYLMNILPLLAIRFKIYKVMLTVFKHNKIAMDFYMNTLKFRIDKSSPSKFDIEADYEILSLKVGKAKK